MDITREEWLRQAVEILDSRIFSGDLDTPNHAFQIACGKVGGKKHSETIQPSDQEDIGLDDFFPTTISIDYQLKTPEEILTQLTFECIKAFFGTTKGKAYKSNCEKYYFESPYNEPHPSDYLKDLIKESLKIIEKQCGPWPGKAVVIRKPAKKQTQNKIIFVCPNCGWEIYTTKSKMKGHEGQPVCTCGTKMSLVENEENEENNKETSHEENNH